MATQKRKAGRPSKLTPQLQATLCDAVRRGAFLHEACATARVGVSTVNAWIQRAEELQEPEYLAFRDALREAEANLVSQAVTAWVRHFDKDFRACESFLKRRFPFTWGELVARSAPPPETEFDLDDPDVVDPELGAIEASEG